MQAKPKRFWIWVFADIEGLLWVLQHNVMAFPASSGSKVTRMVSGDEAVLYVTREAFGDPRETESRLVGIVRVTSPAPKQDRVKIGTRNYKWVVGFEKGIILKDGTGPSVRSLIGQLQLVKQSERWGQYFKGSPIEIAEEDFWVIENAINNWAANHQ